MHIPLCVAIKVMNSYLHVAAAHSSRQMDLQLHDSNKGPPSGWRPSSYTKDALTAAMTTLRMKQLVGHLFVFL